MSAPDLRTAPRPSFLTVETSTWCNLACAGCSRTVAMKAGTWRNRHMSAQTFRALLPNLPDANEVALHGVGEPSLNPDLAAIVAATVASGRWPQVSLVCNGQGKDPDVFRRLHDAGLRRLHLSVDSLTDETAELCRKGTRIDLLRRSLGIVAELGFDLTVNIVASRFNHAEIPATLDQLNQFLTARVLMQQYIDLGNPEGRLDAAQAEGLRARVGEGVAAGRWPNLTIQLHGLISARAEPVCTSPWTSLAVTVEGFLTPCCVNFDPAPMGWADLGRAPFAWWWGQPHIQDFLADYLRQAPRFCHGCHMNIRPTRADGPSVRRAFRAEEMP
jgi:molybdenum cofactor biosynthesis enzyme MoaA